MNKSGTIDILLATYDGERFLAEQIQSILKQTYSSWRLLIRDDGSTDNTVAIIRSYEEKYPGKIILLEDSVRNLGACGNFGVLLQHADADYVMFCDQDDVWLPRKIELTLAKMHGLEQRYGPDIPFLVYTDMKVADKDLNIIADSYWEHQACTPKSGRQFNRLLVSNVVIGCTSMMNRDLRDLLLPLPQEALMHDWWAGLVAAALGKSDFVGEPTMFYRQHGRNVVGATWSIQIGGILNNLKNLKKHRRYLLRTQRQANAFAVRYAHLLPPDDLKKTRIYAALDSRSWFARRYTVIKYGFWWSGALRNVTLLLII
jgi:glycosyltransferase involved in cell wall biosynthesis